MDCFEKIRDIKSLQMHLTLQLITCKYYFVFQNTIMGLTGLFAVLVPDVPFSVKTQILRENLLAREAIYETDINNDNVRV